VTTSISVGECGRTRFTPEVVSMNTVFFCKSHQRKTNKSLLFISSICLVRPENPVENDSVENKFIEMSPPPRRTDSTLVLCCEFCIAGGSAKRNYCARKKTRG